MINGLGGSSYAFPEQVSLCWLMVLLQTSSFFSET